MSDITKKLAALLQPLAKSIDTSLNAVAGERIGFVLVLNAAGVSQYVSNLQRDDGEGLLKNLLERWSPNRVDNPVPVRRVVCAAIRRKDDGAMVCSARHFDAAMHSQIEGSFYMRHQWQEAEQGFIDQFGVFMSRKEAWIVANAAGQVIRRVGGDDGCLYSENLY